MALPLLATRPTTQNDRVPRYFVPSDETPPDNRMDDMSDVDAIIRACYRQIYSEHLSLESSRQKALESQLRNRAITVREFVRGLAKSEIYRDLVMDPNDNYRFMEISFQRILGRATYNQEERIAYSIILATQGLNGFVDALVDGDEYLNAFGEDMVPYQRRRLSEQPANLLNPRYGARWRDRLGMRRSTADVVRSYRASRPLKAGDPAAYLDLARALKPTGAQRQSISVYDLRIPDMTTSRR